MKFLYSLLKLEQVQDGKFDGTSFGKIRSPRNSFQTDESIRADEEQPILDSDIDSPIESTPKLDVCSESGTMTVLTDGGIGGSNPAIRIKNRRLILQEARRRRKFHDARFRKEIKNNACELMLHMMEHAKTSSKGYLKNLYECFSKGQGQLCILFLTFSVHRSFVLSASFHDIFSHKMFPMVEL